MQDAPGVWRRARSDSSTRNRKLFTAAKRNRNRRFHALYDRIWRGDVLLEAWKRVRAKRGAAGIDGETLAEIEAQGVTSFLDLIQQQLKEGVYRARPVRRVYIRKPDGRRRPLGISIVRDRVVQQATKLVLEPIFEADFKACSYGFRPKRSATQAKEVLRMTGNRGHRWVVDADVRGFLISPLLANIYLDALDEAWERDFSHLGRMVRYADDFVIMCKRESQVREALRRVQEILTRLRLELHPDKTKIVELGIGKEGFDFLGCHFRIVRSHFRGRCYLFRWPGHRSMNAIRARLRELTDRRRWAGMKDIREVIAVLNPVLRGWGNYFRSGNASKQFTSLDRFVTSRLTRLIAQREGLKSRPFHLRHWPYSRFVDDFDLYKLLGTIRYPGGAHAT